MENSFLYKLDRFFKKLDIYGHKVDLSINSEYRVQSKVGASLSLSIFILCLYLFSVNWIAWSDNQNLQIISATESLTVTELIMKNESHIYSFDFSNFDIYFILSATFPNGTMLNYKMLRNYFNQTFIYGDQFENSHEIGLESCLVMKQRVYLEQDYLDLQNDPNRTSKWGVCLTKSFQMGLFTDLPALMINLSHISYKVSKCQNSSNNNYSCASNEDINEMLKYVQIQASYPKSTFDFNNPKNPRKRGYNYQFYHMDLRLTKVYTATIKPTFLKTDYGLIHEEYLLETTDFNIDTLNSETLIRNTEDDPLFYLDLSVGFDHQIYYRKNLKIYVFIANFGGIVNILLIIGKIIARYYNRIVVKHQLINIAFTNLEKYQKKKLNCSPADFEFKFLPLSLLFPTITKRKTYAKAISNLEEFIDIKNIIRRLQDIDKLKLILLDDNQRRIFEAIPKPGINNTYSKTRNSESFLTMSTILDPKRILNDLKKVAERLSNEEPINQRLLNLIKNKILLDEEHKKKGRFFIEFNVNFEKVMILKTNKSPFSKNRFLFKHSSEEHFINQSYKLSKKSLKQQLRNKFIQLKQNIGK